MFALDLVTPNKLGAGNAAAPVLSGRGAAIRQEFGPRQRVASPKGARPGPGQEVRRAPDRITQKQALSGPASVQVARSKSHAMAGMAGFCGFWAARRLIASYATRGQLGPVSTRRAGRGGPPRARGRAPYAGRACVTTDLEKPASIGLLSPDCHQTKVSSGRGNLGSPVMGSGVRERATKRDLARNRAGFGGVLEICLGGVRGQARCLSVILGKIAKLESEGG